ncbi:MAG: RsmE family RNA methyltransferase [Candidatus Gastranaerophilales bacterium]|nr:RsmE family RNA methyltransferase [Candidatus Gastranaerophilales bacterium]
MPHFIINSTAVEGCYIRVSGKELYNHIAKAMRVKEGETLMFIDENEVQYKTLVDKISSSEIYTKVVDSYPSFRKLDVDITLAQAVLKPDAQFLAIQKATELGVKNILPLVTDNCVVRESIIKAKAEKWQKIALESVKQCERADIPVVLPYEKLNKDFFDKEYKYIAFVERDADYSLKEFFNLTEINKESKIVIIIGPEGGFSQREFDLFKELEIPQVSLGNLIYRADTACTVAVANVLFGLENGKS